jgi:hypothetical protein
MKLNPILAAALAGACGLASNAARADAFSWDPSASFSGFGTLAYTKTNTDQAQFAEPAQEGGADKDGSIGPDSKIGAQVTAKANSMFSATVQAISKRNGKGNFQPAIEWAFVKAQVLPDLAVRAGRIGAPFYVVSDYLNVNYSNLWVRPPLDVYGQVPFSHFDGADAIYQTSIGGTTITSQAFGGTSTAYSDGTRVHVRDLVGVNFTAEFDNGITLRLGRAQGKLTADSTTLDGLVAILRTTPFAEVGNEIDVVGKKASFTGFGIGYDHDAFVGGAEYTKRKNADYVSSTTGWSATGGYRLGKFTPYVVVSRVKVDSSNVNNTIPASVPQLAPLSAAVDLLLHSQDVSQKTQSIGVRWDAWKNVAVKGEFDRIKPDGGPGLFVSVQPGFGTAPVNVYTLSVDFVF